MIRRRRALTLMEMLVAFSMFLMMVTLVFGITGFTSRAAGVAEPNADLQSATQKALLTFLRQLEESIEFLRPTSGGTLTYFIARSKTNEIHTAYQEEDSVATVKAGRKIYRLVLYRHHPVDPAVSSREVLIENVERLTFTSRSPGLLQVHLKLHEAGRSYTLLTTVRARGIPSEGQL